MAAASVAPAGSPAHAAVGEPELGATYAFTARLNIGQGQRACSGSLVESQWILTAASCFADSPSRPVTVPAGKPKLATTIGRQDASTSTGQVRDVVELVPRADRDLVLAKLSKPVTGVTPVTITASQPIGGERLTIAGYGRTRDQWVPNKLHTGSLDVSAVTGSALDLSGQTPVDGSVCKGDAGGPSLRKNGGRLELVGIHSTSNEAGCIGSEGAVSHAREARVDDVRSWIATHVARWSTKANANNKYVAGEFNESGSQKGKLRARSDRFVGAVHPAQQWHGRLAQPALAEREPLRRRGGQRNRIAPGNAAGPQYLRRRLGTSPAGEAERRHVRHQVPAERQVRLGRSQ
ncbi:S1 family peptidase [Streptomyces bacillaris]|uniref:S1 family peptidase n=1 Tax=Streptomyces bacillaris TaxID=68179 RepID=UPI0034600246